MSPVVHSLARRIRAALLGVTVFAIAAVTVGAVIVGYHALHTQMENHLRALALVTATQAQAPMVFRDAEAARGVLAAIPPEEGVVDAELRDADGALVARVRREGDAPRTALIPGERVVAAVVMDGRRIGELTLRTDGGPLLRGLAALLAFDLMAALLAGAVVLVIARRLTARITRPLTELARVMDEVRERRDFALRAPASGIAEIESLRNDFHALLDEIRRRDADLERTNAVLKRLALRDALTGLPNRTMFERALLDAFARIDGAARIGLLYFDVDSFKSVNDTFGHAVGDLVLRAVGERLGATLPEGAMPARIGGDEFVVLVARAASEAEVAALADRVQSALQAPLPIDGHILYPGVSVGHVSAGASTAHPDELVKLADEAMYSSKSRRKVEGLRTRWEPRYARGAA